VSWCVTHGAWMHQLDAHLCHLEGKKSDAHLYVTQANYRAWVLSELGTQTIPYAYAMSEAAPVICCVLIRSSRYR
jgi:hypothetical protein